MGITPSEITQFPAVIDWNAIHQGLVARAQNGDPKAMMAIAKNNVEAKVAIEAWLEGESQSCKAGVQMSTSCGAISLAHFHVREDRWNGEPTGNIRVYGYIKGLHKRGDLRPSFELSLDKESAKALAKAILATL